MLCGLVCLYINRLCLKCMIRTMEADRLYSGLKRTQLGEKNQYGLRVNSKLPVLVLVQYQGHISRVLIGDLVT